VRASNAQALGLYASRDFKVLYRRKGYYSDNGEDALVMLCNFAAGARGDSSAASGSPPGGEDRP
jgi:ribosomal-protein-alanine N-acetyltransferase